MLAVVTAAATSLSFVETGLRALSLGFCATGESCVQLARLSNNPYDAGYFEVAGL